MNHKKKYIVLFAALYVAATATFAQSQRGTEITKAKPQVPLIGEIVITKIPDSLYREKMQPIVNESKLLTAGYITRKKDSFGKIIKNDLEKEVMSVDDMVTINRGSDKGVKKGDEYYVYKRGRKIKDPNSRKRYGRLITILGSMVITEVKPRMSKARILKTYDLVEVGHGIIPKYKLVIPEIDMDRPLEDKTIEGTILAVRDNKTEVAERDIVYLNVGRKNGVTEGDIFKVSREIEKVGKVFEEKKFFSFRKKSSGFKKHVGKVKAITVREETSTAIVVDSSLEIAIGDYATYIQERL